MIFQMFGVGGVQWDMTLRELVQMYEGRERTEWGRTALIACILANSNRDPSKQRRPFTVDQFNPYSESRNRMTGTGTPLNRNTLSLFATAISSIVRR